MTLKIINFLMLLGVVSAGCSAISTNGNENQKTMSNQMNLNEGNQDPNTLDTITLGAGCFWCVEAIFDNLKGIHTVISGYSGGEIKNPSYKEVCRGTTGHAEVIQLTYDTNTISLDEILEVFFLTHDPTTLNRQGADVGTQYRSAIFYHNAAQKEIAQNVKKKLDNSGAYPNPIVTEISAFSIFYAAEDYHQEYYELNGEQPYCRAVIRPKMEKFEKVFKDKMK